MEVWRRSCVLCSGWEPTGYWNWGHFLWTTALLAVRKPKSSPKMSKEKINSPNCLYWLFHSLRIFFQCFVHSFFPLSSFHGYVSKWFGRGNVAVGFRVLIAVKPVNLFRLVDLSKSYMLLVIEMLFWLFLFVLTMWTDICIHLFFFSFRSTEFTRKASSSEKETESVVVLDPVSASGDRTSESTSSQNKTREESKPLHKETNVEKIKETDSSSC